MCCACVCEEGGGKGLTFASAFQNWLKVGPKQCMRDN